MFASSAFAFGLLLTCAASAAASPIAIAGVTTNLGNGFSTNITHVIDGSGLSSYAPDATHAIAQANNSWVSANGTAGQITFDLGSVFAIDGMAVWNFNNVSTFGVNRVNVLSSLDGVTYSPIAVAPDNFGIGASSAPELAQLFSLTTTAEFIRFNILSSYGGLNVALSEVMFTGTATVPEPATFGLVGIGIATAAFLKDRILL